MQRFVNFLFRFYWLVIVLCLASTAFTIPRMVHLLKNISTDPIDLLPQDYPSVQSLLRINEGFQSYKRFAIVLESPHPDRTLAALESLAPSLEKVASVGKVHLTKPGYDFFDKNKFLYLEKKDLEEIRDRIDRRIQREKLGAFYIDLEGGGSKEELDFSDMQEKYLEKYGDASMEKHYVSPDGKTYGLYVESKESNLNITKEKRFQDEVKQAVDAFDYRSFDPGMKLYFAGSTRVMEYRALVRDLKIAGTISGVILLLPLLIRFRKPQYLLLIFLPLVVGVPLGMSLTSIFIHKLNITTSFLFAILGGLGVESGIHLFSRYYGDRAQGVDSRRSILDLFTFMGPAVLTAVASLAVTFLLMAFSDFRGFSEFGLISGIGLITVFLLYFSFFPALLVAAEKLRWLRLKVVAEAKIESKVALTTAFVKTVLTVFSLFTVFSILVAPKIRFEYDTKKIRADHSADAVAKRKQRLTQGKRINNPAAVLIHSEEEAEQLKAKVAEIKAKNPNSLLDTTGSVYFLVPDEQSEKMLILQQIQDLLADDTIRLVKNEKKKDLDRFKLELKKPAVFGFAEVPEEVKNAFLGKNRDTESLFLIFPKPRLEMDDGQLAMRFAEEVGTLRVEGGVYHPSSSAIVFGEVLRTMFRDSKKIMWIAVISVFAFVYLDFRQWKTSLLIMTSILSGIAWVMGVMYLLGIKLNLYNMVMLPAVMGMSVDNSIHVYHRYKELGKGSLYQVLKDTGLSSALASFTNAAGFLGLVFCSHGGLRSMGIVAVTGLVTCLLTTLVFLPMFLQFLEWRSERVRT